METHSSSSHYAWRRRLGAILAVTAVLIAGTVYSAARAPVTSADTCFTTTNMAVNCGLIWNGFNWVYGNGNVAYPSNFSCASGFYNSCNYVNTPIVYVPPVTSTAVYVPPTTTSYTYAQPIINSAYTYPAATVLDTVTNVSDQPVYVPPNVSYPLEGAGGYCSIASGEQIWVPAGASPASMGCAS